MVSEEIEQLISLLAKLPGLGPRSARRAALNLIKRKETLMQPLAKAMAATAEQIKTCSVCGNLDTRDPCKLCNDPRRDPSIICVVEDVADLWALERTVAFRGHYHVLGGTLSALDGVSPDDLRIPQLVERANVGGIKEVILATNATVDGQTTAHYIADRLEEKGIAVSGLAHGVPVGGELDYLDDGTISAALKARGPI
ncbi:MAG: recombination mediator RecR [Rhodospirillales bacterium]|nr:recombination mediator RecR [Rhodospirillales bacterium]